MVKVRKSEPTEKEIEKVANELADRTYGKEKDKTVGTSITIPQSLLHQAEDVAFQNKRNGIEPNNVSAIIRASLIDYLSNK